MNSNRGVIIVFLIFGIIASITLVLPKVKSAGSGSSAIKITWTMTGPYATFGTLTNESGTTIRGVSVAFRDVKTYVSDRGFQTGSQVFWNREDDYPTDLAPGERTEFIIRHGPFYFPSDEIAVLNQNGEELPFYQVLKK